MSEWDGFRMTWSCAVAASMQLARVRCWASESWEAARMRWPRALLSPLYCFRSLGPKL